MYKAKSKAERKQWWNNLTTEEQGKYIKAKQAEKAQKRQFHDERDEMSSREQMLFDEDYMHLLSITGKDYTKGVVT